MDGKIIKLKRKINLWKKENVTFIISLQELEVNQLKKKGQKNSPTKIDGRFGSLINGFMILKMVLKSITTYKISDLIFMVLQK